MYGTRNWGVEQADAYAERIDAPLALLCENPGIGTADRVRGRDFRRWSIGSHVILYSDDGKCLRVLRVLHSRMDVSRHFP